MKKVRAKWNEKYCEHPQPQGEHSKPKIIGIVALHLLNIGIHRR